MASINCTAVYTDIIDLEIISQHLDDFLFRGSSQSSEYVIEKLVIENSAVKQIPSKAFTRISFIQIILRDNKMLEFVDKNAFDGSIHTLKTLKIIDNRNLYNDHEEDIWKFVSKFIHLEDLVLNGNNLRSIPSYAFKPKEGDLNLLRHVEINNNNIHTIGDFAFESLTAPSLRLWLKHNKISTIGGNAFKFKKSREHVIRLIDLSNNLLTTDSFDSQTFWGMGRPLATLILNNNQISTLSQQVFEPLFDRSDKNYFQLEVESNPFDCDCSLYWVLTTKYCYDKTIGRSAVVNDHIINLRCLPNRAPITSVDFTSCGTSEKLSPSCLKGQNNALSLSLNKFNGYLFAINAVIVFRLIY